MIKESTLNGVQLINSGIRQSMDIIIVGIMKSDGEMTFNPHSQTQIQAGDTLIALGKAKNLEKLSDVAAGNLG